MKLRNTGIGLVIALSFLASACRVAKTPLTVEQKARVLHDRMLTIDTHCDTAFSLLQADWKIGDRHDPSARGAGKIDLPPDLLPVRLRQNSPRHPRARGSP